MGIRWIYTCVCFLVVMISLLVVICDYRALKKSLPEINALTQEVSRKTKEISNQRNQIQKFAVKINILKSKLVTLNNFEKKLREIANIGDPIGPDGLFGIGGSVPADLDTHIPEKKNTMN